MNRYLTSSLNAIEEYLAHNHKGSIYATENPKGRLRQILDLARKKGLRVEFLDSTELVKTARSAGFQGQVRNIFLLGQDPGSGKFKSRLEDLIPSWEGDETRMILVLQGITDPHNLGAILRVADQFAADAVLIPERRSAGMSETVSRVSSGADQHVNLIETVNLARALEQLKKAGFWVYGADMGGENIAAMSFSAKSVLVLGSEGKGLGRLIESTCDQIISIPTGGHIDSLNVSVAAGILAYEVRRQQGFP